MLLSKIYDNPDIEDILITCCELKFAFAWSCMALRSSRKHWLKCFILEQKARGNKIGAVCDLT